MHTTKNNSANNQSGRAPLGSRVARWFAAAFMLFVTVLPQRGAESQEAGTTLIPLRGLSTAEVVRRFGDPDERRPGSAGREAWSYGKSLVFFSDGRVSGWSDGGDFSKRENLSGIRRTIEADGPRNVLWVNDWTPNTRQKVEDQVLSEMLQKEAR